MVENKFLMKFKNIIQNLGANLLITLLGLVGSIILARWLGPSQRGVFAAIILFPAILQYFVNFGLSSTTVYFTAKQNSNKYTIWNTLILLGFFQSLVGILIGYFIVDMCLQQYGYTIVDLGQLYLFTIPLGLFGMYATYILQGASQFKAINFLKCVVPVGYCVGIIFLKLQFSLSVKNLVYLQLIIQSFYLIIAIFLLYKLLLFRFNFNVDYNFIPQILTYSVKVWFGDIAQLVNSRFDQFLIIGILSTQDLGIYTVALSVSRLTSVFADAVNTIMVPLVTGKNSLHEKVAETLNFFKKYWIFSIAFHTIYVLSLPILIPVVFGNAYSEAVSICQVLVIGSFFVNAKIVLGGGISGMGFPEIMSYVEVTGLLISCTLSIIFINLYGLLGVSIAISLSYFVQFIVLIFFTNKKLIPYKNILYTSRSDIYENLDWLKNTSNYLK